MSVRWPFLFTVILELSIGPGGSLKRKDKLVVTITEQNTEANFFYLEIFSMLIVSKSGCVKMLNVFFVTP